MLLKQIFLGFTGLCAGIIAAGVSRISGDHRRVSRLMGRTGTRRHLILYETVIVAGGIEMCRICTRFPFHGQFFGTLFLGIFGLTAGIFVGCLVMSLAETDL